MDTDTRMFSYNLLSLSRFSYSWIENSLNMFDGEIRPSEIWDDYPDIIWEDGPDTICRLFFMFEKEIFGVLNFGWFDGLWEALFLMRLMGVKIYFLEANGTIWLTFYSSSCWLVFSFTAYWDKSTWSFKSWSSLTQ